MLSEKGKSIDGNRVDGLDVFDHEFLQISSGSFCLICQLLERSPAYPHIVAPAGDIEAPYRFCSFA